VFIVAPLAAACVAALATLAATGITLSRTNLREQRRLDHEERREQRRLAHEERMQREKLKNESQEAWRVERKEAYSVLFSLARDVAATRNAPSRGNNVPSKAPPTPEGLRQAHATVELVGETDDLVTAANSLYEECKRIQNGLPESRPNGYREAREAFWRYARDELGLPPLPLGS
jgi:hypothetical protein